MLLPLSSELSPQSSLPLFNKKGETHFVFLQWNNCVEHMAPIHIKIISFKIYWSRTIMKKSKSVQNISESYWSITWTKSSFVTSVSAVIIAITCQRWIYANIISTEKVISGADVFYEIKGLKTLQIFGIDSKKHYFDNNIVII